MKPNSLTLTATVSTLVALSIPTFASISALSVEKISFAPKEGTIVTKTFQTTTSMDSEDYEMLLDGEPIPGMPAMEMTMESTQSLTVTDEYGSMTDGRLNKLGRTYDSIVVSSDMNVDAGIMKQEVTATGTSPLESKSVVFAWDEKEAEFGKEFAEGESGEAELLEGLKLDLDLADLLPSEELAEGETYEIEPGALVTILAPGGDMKLEMEVEGGAGGMGGPTPDQVGDMSEFFIQGVTGEVTGTFKGTREVDGVNVAVIALSATIAAEADMAEKMAELGDAGMPPGMDVEVDRMLTSMEYEGAGELLWNLDKGHIHSMTLKADLTIKSDMTMTMNQEAEMAMKTTMVGTATTLITTD